MDTLRAHVLAAAMLVAVSTVAAAHARSPGDADPPPDPTPPCPDLMEVLCDDPPRSGSGWGAQVLCPCGPGKWVQLDPEIAMVPPIIVNEESEVGLFNVGKKVIATPNSASASILASGRSSCWFGCSTGSTALAVNASYEHRQKEVWQGEFPACPRAVALVATGQANQSVGVSTTADRGCSTSSSSSVSGSCSSRGNANAELTNTLTAKAQFNSSSTKVTLSGNIGAAINLESPSVQGSFSMVDSWEAEGVGSATGTASFTVKPNRTYCAFTNKPITRSAAGTVVVSGSASVASGGSSAFQASGYIKLRVD